MKKILLWGLIALSLLAFAIPAQATNKFWWASCLTGGGDCLDGVDGSALTAGDGAIVARDAGSTTPEIYFYRVYDSSASESSPAVIAPDTNPGTHRWHLINIVGKSLQVLADDGNNRLTVASNTSRTPAASANELYPIANVWNGAENGSNVGQLFFGSKENSGTGSVKMAGILDGLANYDVKTSGSPLAVGGTGKIEGYYLNDTASAYEFDLPTPPGAGQQYCFEQAPARTSALTVKPVTNHYLGKTDNSAYCTQSYKLVSGGAATDKICVTSVSTTQWKVNSSVGTWTCTTP